MGSGPLRRSEGTRLSPRVGAEAVLHRAGCRESISGPCSTSIATARPASGPSGCRSAPPPATRSQSCSTRAVTASCRSGRRRGVTQRIGLRTKLMSCPRLSDREPMVWVPKAGNYPFRPALRLLGSASLDARAHPAMAGGLLPDRRLRSWLLSLSRSVCPPTVGLPHPGSRPVPGTDSPGRRETGSGSAAPDAAGAPSDDGGPAQGPRGLWDPSFSRSPRAGTPRLPSLRRPTRRISRPRGRSSRPSWWATTRVSASTCA